MIIGFLGKGGSGKSTVSHRFARFLHEKGNKVLAIDLDYNMDTTFNLGITDETHPKFPYLGVLAKDSIYKYSKIKDGDFYDDLFTKDIYSTTLPVFHIFDNVDEFTDSFSVEIRPRLRVMSMGPHHERIIQGGACSHFMAVSMKIYLPLIETRENEYVIIDEKASTDSVGTGIPSGFDVAYICVENTPHSIKTAGLIIDHLKELETPYEIVANKVRDKDQDTKNITARLGKSPIISLSMDIAYIDPNDRSAEEEIVFLELLKDVHIKKSKIETGQTKTRKNRTIDKFEKHKQYRAENS
jgi:CO dehydrogenase maturation factor